MNVYVLEQIRQPLASGESSGEVQGVYVSRAAAEATLPLVLAWRADCLWHDVEDPDAPDDTWIAETATDEWWITEFPVQGFP